MKQIQSKLRQTARQLLSEGKVDLLIGYRQGSLPLKTTPCFVSQEEEAVGLVWNSFCTNNLAVYLPGLFRFDPRSKKREQKKVGIVVKGCDCRSLVGHLKEGQVPRENLVIIGLPCQGIIDEKKIVAKLEGKEIVKAEEQDGQILVVDEKGQETRLAKEDFLRDSCLVCQHPVPPLYDILIEGETARQAVSDEYTEVKELEERSIDQRWEFFQGQMSKCIRCYACRNACPLCYCPECFAEQSQPRWVGTTDDPSDIMAFHLGRIFHTAGRCVDCGACEAACPMGLELRKLTRKLVKDVGELFGYEAGVSAEEPPPLATYKLDDDDEFIK
jgi:ferredoxin